MPTTCKSLTTSYSTFPVVKKLTRIQSSAVTAYLKPVFEEHGIPIKLVTVTAHSTHLLSSRSSVVTMNLLTARPIPCILQSYADSEESVDCLSSFAQVLCLHRTSLSHDLPSPAELLNGRVQLTNLPAVSKPSFSANGDINVKLKLRQDKQKVQCDKVAQQPLRSLFPEDRIRVFNPASGTWTPGIVHHVADTPRSTGEAFRFRSDEVPEDVPVADSISCAADRGEHSTSSAPLAPVSGAVLLLGHPSMLRQSELRILLLCCHFVDPVEESRLQTG